MSTYPVGAYSTPQQGCMSTLCAKLAHKPTPKPKYVFYYNYITRFSALFPVFIVTLSQTDHLRFLKTVTKKGVTKVLGVDAHSEELWGLVREMCNPGKG